MDDKSCTRVASQTDASVFDQFINDNSPSFLKEELPERNGERPSTEKCLPHQQLTQNPTMDIWLELKKRVFSLEGVSNRPSMVSVPGAEALWLLESIRGKNFMIGREFAHVHPLRDGSMHLRLAVRDAKQLLVKKWGELHLVAAMRTIAPIGLVMVYAPRTLEEVETVFKIVKASYEFARSDVDEPGNSAVL